MPSLPSRIGRYVIKSLIGRGGMGELYLAHDPNTNRLVTLKLLNATLDSSALRERFAREARALAALNHPNIVNIYDSGEFEGSPFIVMEYVRGETLEELIKRRAPLSISQKLKLLAELCAGLAQAHEAGIIHRDIKPANLMVDQQGRLKILDFGIARFAEGSKTRIGLPLTQVNTMIGTPGYMSPEQIERGEVDHRSDIFAVGAVAYELLSYAEAFSGPDTYAIERRVVQAQPTPLAALLRGLDPEIDEIVLRAMKREPIKRYQDAATFERALERLRARLDSEVPPSPPRPTLASPQNTSGKPREARAEAAYQRALAARQGGALEAARRFAVEAVAEDPSHAKARAFLASLQPAPPVPATAQSAEELPPTVVSTSFETAASTIASAPTIIVTPAAKVPPSPKRHQAPTKDSGSSTPRDRWAKRGERQTWRQSALLWNRYQKPIAAAAAVILLVVLVFAVLWTFTLGPSGELLTVTRPVGGTVSADGINCGTRGSGCSTRRPNGDLIEFRHEADAGYAFSGYTGDCAPGGRTLMNGPRTCGATFAPVTGPPPAADTQLLTIAPVPTGGTLEGVDIICGTKGSICSANHPDGVPVDLHPTADAEFTFMGFTGDCAPLGHTQMSAPRTCSATFSRIADIAATTPTVPRPGRRDNPIDRGGSTTSSSVPSTQPPSRPPPAQPPKPPTTSDPSPPPVAAGAPPPPGPVAPPPTDEQYAKTKIQELLKEYCDAYEAIDPIAVQRVYPKVNIEQLRGQLNRSKYKSIQCTFGEPTYLALHAEEGTAKVRAAVKRVFTHTIPEREEVELIAVMTLIRSAPRSPWQIDQADYSIKPK